MKLGGNMDKNEIKKIRLSRGLSKGEFAKLIGVNRNTIFNWESGRCLPHDFLEARLVALREKK